ncbi:MAG: hypothetical protein HY538_04675 [Deltaproteobacteria bacterium]|nr:hypothetical protein [Deltaproteobacteria bacterium]
MLFRNILYLLSILAFMLWGPALTLADDQNLFIAQEDTDDERELDPIKTGEPAEKDSEEEEDRFIREGTEIILEKVERAWDKTEDDLARGFRNYGGAGGASTGYLFTSFNEINNAAQAAGLPTLSDNIITIGGRGYGTLNRHFRIGGGGYGAFPKSEEGSRGGTTTQLKFGMGYGGVILDYVFQWRRTEWALGGLMGGGGYNLQLNGPSTTNFDEKIRGGFFVLQPHMGVLYKINRWAGVEFEASYFWTNMGDLNGSFGEGVSSPDADFNGLMLTVTPTLGWFID